LFNSQLLCYKSLPEWWHLHQLGWHLHLHVCIRLFRNNLFLLFWLYCWPNHESMHA
jgi:hypothetical protein